MLLRWTAGREGASRLAFFRLLPTGTFKIKHKRSNASYLRVFDCYHHDIDTRAVYLPCRYYIKRIYAKCVGNLVIIHSFNGTVSN